MKKRKGTLTVTSVHNLTGVLKSRYPQLRVPGALFQSNPFFGINRKIYVCPHSKWYDECREIDCVAAFIHDEDEAHLE